MRTILLAAILSIALSGCVSFGKAVATTVAERVIRHVVTGTWEKTGSTRDDYFGDNWDCQQANGRFDATVGFAVDLEAYNACMVDKGWILTPFELQ